MAKLYYLKDTGCLWMAGNAFGLHPCTVSKTLSKVCPKYLYFPRNTEEMREIVSKFEVKFRILQVFCCIDGTIHVYVPLKKPLINSQDFYNYKHFFH